MPAFPDALDRRVAWTVHEGLVLLAILLFWLTVGVGILVGLGLLQLLIRSLGLPELRFLFVIVDHGAGVWAAITPLASATAALYVIVRAGTILIDRYRAA